MSCYRNYKTDLSRGHSSILEDFCSRALGNYGFLQVFASSSNENIKMSSFKSSGDIQKKESRSDKSVSNNQFSSVTLKEQAIKARETIL